MPTSGSLYFPFEQDGQTRGLRRAITVNQTIVSAMRAFILTDKGSRLGNPIGSFLPTLKHQLINTAQLSAASKELQKELTDQFPGVIFIDIAITKVINTDNAQPTSDLQVVINFNTPLSDIQQLTLLV
jgi:hypothetical protein